MRNILIVEPGFKTKFPPLGLMKISQYHKYIGDNVYFVKGTILNNELQYMYWDRVYISTVFTYNWKITVDTINFFKSITKDPNKIFVGGILASLMPNEIWEATGVIPIQGLLDKPHILDENNNLLVDMLTPDYNLFDNSNTSYKLLDKCYIGYSTRGCINKCSFCGVPILEPDFIDYIDIKPIVNSIRSLYGEKKNLILLDNNVFASKNFNQIIDDIRNLGFERGSKLNNRFREVDFNQGVDSRLVDDNKMKLLSTINIKPLRIAFDHLSLKDVYISSIRTAAKYGIRNLSNYLLYNYNDSPEDLWKRIKINIDLNKELDLRIWSFPMKFIPIFGEDSKDRKYISRPLWNYQYIRGVQRILNVLKGTVSASEEFFYRAFGSSEEEFKMILLMPENILMNRGRERKEEELIWISKYNSLIKSEKNKLIEILDKNRTKKSLLNSVIEEKSNKIKSILEMYVSEESLKQFTLKY